MLSEVVQGVRGRRKNQQAFDEATKGEFFGMGTYRDSTQANRGRGGRAIDDFISPIVSGKGVCEHHRRD